jgi:hypothetical protein
MPGYPNTPSAVITKPFADGQCGVLGYARLLMDSGRGMSNGLARSFDRLLRIVE